MRRPVRGRQVLSRAALVFAFAIAGVAVAFDPAGKAPIAEVLSPREGDRIPREGQDTLCPEGSPCTRIFVEGRVEPGYWPALAVAPIVAPTPRIWIQPAITGVKKDGRFTGMVYLGTEREGAGEKFNIFVLADKDKERFHEGQILTAIPKDCAASDPVTVLRTR